ncbi:MAG: glycosyltransferase family 4 protein [Candidatus Heimdallarchaeota archaeon]|nr:glycosyltransferase family 4 protein [Candidatus Heimdallarchaeota archaeon]MCK5049530.1 glycosyltransferase family 4 protein [Candidatus Heimdallarchaeota archaeon]
MRKRLKITFITDTDHPKSDGVVRFLDGVRGPLLERGHKITMLIPKFPSGGPNPYRYEGVTYYEVPAIPRPIVDYHISYPIPWILKKAIEDADIVFVHDVLPLGQFGLWMAKLLKKPTSFFCHHDERPLLISTGVISGVVGSDFFARILGGIIEQFISIFYKSVDQFFAATNRFSSKILRFKTPIDKIVRIPFAIDLDRFKPGTSPHLRERHGIPQDAKVGLFIGRISPEKNADVIIKAVKETIKKYDDFYVVFGGRGILKDEFTKVAEESNGRIIYTDWILEEELADYYRLGDFFIMPSLHESTSFTVLEAMATGLPCIMSGFQHCKEFQEGENAFFVYDVRDVKEVISAIDKMMNLTDEKRLEMTSNNRTILESRSWEQSVTLIEDAWYEQLKEYNERLSKKKK